ncbi:MAG: c-type cytochrome [Nitrospirota bacterium]|nr:c-type cytochrome [Nitrospirota bacterium]
MDASSMLTLPPDPISFQQGPGSNIASSYCLICHSAEYIYTQPPHPHERWTEIIKKMKQTFGCPIPDEQIPPLAQYLFSQNKVQPILVVKKVKTSDKGSKDKRGNTEKGNVVYESHCLHCHGHSGKGDGPIGKALIPPAADLTAVEKKSDNTLLKTIRNGIPGTAMPSWKNDLSGQEIEDVLAYIRQLGKK